MKHKILFVALFVLLAAVFSVVIVDAQGPNPRNPRAPQTALGTGFTYQGQLKNGGVAVNGVCDFQFGLWDVLTLGAQVGVTQTVSSVSVTNGLFTTTLNGSNEFGATAFDGNARWLAITTRCPAGSGSYTALNPRQELTATPYALTAMKTAYKNVLVVAKSGGHYNTISAALASITDNSASNRYLIWVAPGTYNETITMKQYVDIEGAGELATKITFTGSALHGAGTVLGADNAELRFLSVENTGGSTYAKAINNDGASPRLTHLTVTASGGASNYGINNNNASSPTMTNLTIIISGGQFGYGVYNYNASAPKMTDLTVTISGVTNTCNGVYNTTNSSPTMTNVTIIASSQQTSYGVFNIITSSPTMTNMTIYVAGGQNSVAVSNTGASPKMMNLFLYASGGTVDNQGVLNGTSSSPTLTNVTITASGGQNSYGVYNSSSSATIKNSTITVSGGSVNNNGIFNYATSGTYTVFVNNSQVTSTDNTIQSDSEFTVRVGASKLAGDLATSGGGTLTCAGVYDENYVFYASTCP